MLNYRRSKRYRCYRAGVAKFSYSASRHRNRRVRREGRDQRNHQHAGNKSVPGKCRCDLHAGPKPRGIGGDDVTTEVKNVVDALTGGVEATIKFGTELNALNATEIDNIRTMALHGDAAGAVTKASI